MVFSKEEGKLVRNPHAPDGMRIETDEDEKAYLKANDISEAKSEVLEKKAGDEAEVEKTPEKHSSDKMDLECSESEEDEETKFVMVGNEVAVDDTGRTLTTILRPHKYRPGTTALRDIPTYPRCCVFKQCRKDETEGKTTHQHRYVYLQPTTKGLREGRFVCFECKMSCECEPWPSICNDCEDEGVAKKAKVHEPGRTPETCPLLIGLTRNFGTFLVCRE
jgi:hypothetical protein